MISGLGVGGAERSLLRLAGGLARDGYAQQVLCASRAVDLVPDFETLGVSVVECGLDAGVLGGLRRARAAVRAFAPALVHGWMYHGNLLASLASGGVPTIWGVRHSAERLEDEPWRLRTLVRGGALRCFEPKRVIYNSRAGQRSHAVLGYGRFATAVIPNGVDAVRFRPDPAARARWRADHGVGAEDFLVGFVGRHHPTKDVTTLLRAVRVALTTCPNLRVALVGAGMTRADAALFTVVERLGLADRALLLGPQDDMPAVYPGFDLLALTSLSEGMPNVLLEAMCCGVPCVTTDVGDAASVVADANRVVARGDVLALAEVLVREAARPAEARAALAAAVRARAVAEFSERNTLRAYEALYAEIVAGA